MSNPLASSATLAILVVTGCSASTTIQPDDPNAAQSASATAPTASASAAPIASAPAGGGSSMPLPPPAGRDDWVKPNPKGKANGAACTKPDDCQSGVCEGQGCTTGPVCVAADRNCTRDLVAFCGCDGKSFSSSGSCPGRPFSKKGVCSP